MANFGDIFLVNTKAADPLNADAAGAPSDQKPSKVSDFVTKQSFASFAVSSAVVKTIWKAFQKAGGGWADSAWFPLVVSGLIGLGQFVLAWRNEDSKLESWDHILLALIIAVTNTLVLWAAAVGIEPAAADIGITSGASATPTG